MTANSPARKATAGNRTLKAALTDVLTAIRENPGCFPGQVSHTRIAISLANGERLELEMGSSSAGETGTDAEEVDLVRVAHFHAFEAEKAFFSVDELDLGASAKAAAEDLLSQFPNDVKFTSGRRSISEQASAMAPNVVKNRKWIEQTYKDTPQRAALQKWIDDHPEAKTAPTIAAGLEAVMNGWKDTEKQNFSRHITGYAFDVQPVTGGTGEKIKEAINKLPNLHKFLTREGGLEIWHAQFDA